MNEPLPTFDEVAERLGVTICSHECNLRSLEAHRRGYALTVGSIHWGRRAMTRRGLWNFLKVVASQGVMAPRVQEIWFVNTRAYGLALGLGFRLPREWADTDRARVRSLLTPPVDRRLDERTRETIERWARE